MMRLRAVRSLLVEDVAGLPRLEEAPAGEEPAGRDDEASRREDLTLARRRAITVTGICAGALIVLFVLRDRGLPWLSPDRGEGGVFTLGVLLVAAYAGFRLAQYLHLRTVTRLWEELGERAED